MFVKRVRAACIAKNALFYRCLFAVNMRKALLRTKNYQIQESFTKLHLGAFFAPQKPGFAGPGPGYAVAARPCGAAPLQSLAHEPPTPLKG
jgi:hypothetical protein